MNTRIKQLRKALNLNQTEFGTRLGIKQGTVAGYETGAKNPMDSVIISICREFNVNETWLRTGEGEMFQEKSEEDLLMEFAKDLSFQGDDSFKKRLITTLAQMDEESWSHFEKWAYKFLDRFKEGKEAAAGGIDIDEEVEAYRQELLLQKKKESEVSDITEEGA